MISNVEVALRDGKIIAKVILSDDTASADTEFAYYVYRNKQRVHVQWYSNSKTFQYDVTAEPALYCIQAFMQPSSGAITSKISKDILLDEVIADLPDYSRWKLPVIEGTLDNPSVLSAGQDGIFRLKSQSGLVLDVLASGLSRLQTTQNEAPVLLVSFNGAIAGRQKYTAPFFSGSGMAKRLELPVLAFADPAITRDKTLSLGWYAGFEDYPQLIEDIAAIVDWVAEHYNARLVVFGGSGGGFATLNVLSLIKAQASAFIWNPQTSISEYAPSLVERYLKSAFPQAFFSTLTADAKMNNVFFRSVLNKVGITYDLTQAVYSENKQILYIQNSSDQHVLNHAGPFMSHGEWLRQSDRVFTSATKQTTLWFGLWGEGHATPEADVIYSVLQQMVLQQPLTDIADYLDQEHNTLDTKFCAFNVDKVTPKIELACCKNEQRIAAVVLTDINDFGLTYAFQLTDNNGNKFVNWYTPEPYRVLDVPDAFTGKLTMTVYVSDPLGVKFTKSISL